MSNHVWAMTPSPRGKGSPSARCDGNPRRPHGRARAAARPATPEPPPEALSPSRVRSLMTSAAFALELEEDVSDAASTPFSLRPRSCEGGGGGAVGGDTGGSAGRSWPGEKKCLHCIPIPAFPFDARSDWSESPRVPRASGRRQGLSRASSWKRRRSGFVSHDIQGFPPPPSCGGITTFRGAPPLL